MKRKGLDPIKQLRSVIQEVIRGFSGETFHADQAFQKVLRKAKPLVRAAGWALATQRVRQMIREQLDALRPIMAFSQLSIPGLETVRLPDHLHYIQDAKDLWVELQAASRRQFLLALVCREDQVRADLQIVNFMKAVAEQTEPIHASYPTMTMGDALRELAKRVGLQSA